MKLFHAAASPYARKVVACAITRGIEGRITLVPTNPHLSPPELVAANPMSKIPCLLTEDGVALFDSPVICEYLDSIGDAPALFPDHGGARWRALKHQALGDGIMDAAVARRMEQGRPSEAARDEVMARHKAAIDRAVAGLEAELPHRSTDIGTISLACALGYLDLRFAAEDWRATAPGLAAWLESFAVHAGIAKTVPAG